MPQSPSPSERFEQLYVEHCPAIRRYVRRRAEGSAVEDAVSETFLIAWRRLDAVPGDPLPWLLAVARRVLANERRASGRRERLNQRLAAEPQAATPPSAEARAVLEALAALPERDREVLLLVCWEGLDSRRAARAIGTTAIAVRMRLHRARRRLAVLLAEADHPTGELHALSS